MAGAKLKDVQIKKAKPSEKPYQLFDGGGLFLYVTPSGSLATNVGYSQVTGIRTGV